MFYYVYLRKSYDLSILFGAIMQLGSINYTIDELYNTGSIPVCTSNINESGEVPTYGKQKMLV